MEFQNGKWGPINLEDPENVNERRTQVGLGTMEDYIETINQVYGTPKPKKKAKEKKLK